jgi:hypothetical protein
MPALDFNKGIKMKIVNIDSYRDGGTLEITTENGKTYWVDRRIRTKTLGQIYDAHPNKGILLPNQLDLIAEISEAIKEWNKNHLEHHFPTPHEIIKNSK